MPAEFRDLVDADNFLPVVVQLVSASIYVNLTD